MDFKKLPVTEATTVKDLNIPEVQKRSISSLMEYIKRVFVVEVEGHHIALKYDAEDDILTSALFNLDEYDFIGYSDNIVQKLIKKLKGLDESFMLGPFLTECPNIEEDGNRFLCSPQRCFDLITKHSKEYKAFRNKHKNSIMIVHEPPYGLLLKAMIAANTILNKITPWDAQFGGQRVPQVEAIYYRNQPNCYLILHKVDKEIVSVNVLIEREKYLSISLKADYTTKYSGIGTIANLECFHLGMKLKKPVDFLDDNEEFTYKSKLADIVGHTYKFGVE